MYASSAFPCTFALALLLITVAAVAADADSEITKFMKHLEVIPDVIDVGPKEFLKVDYSNGLLADKGVELTPTQVQHAPSVTWTAESPDTYYTLIKTDPDAPSRAEPKYREWHHWLVGNIPGNELAKGEVLSAYIGAGPPKDTGLHRYVFLLYKQKSGKIKFTEAHLPDDSSRDRALFSARKFAEKYDLGVPVAGNLYTAQYDDYVPKLYARLKA